MIIGFTGTQRGMTQLQLARVHHDVAEVALLGDATLVGHHGDCIGADSDFHRIVRMCGGLIHRHPPNVSTKRAFLDFDWDCIELPYLERNRAIVKRCEGLIATPGEPDEVLRSGTWSTIRYAHKRNLAKILVINPDGSTNTDWSTPFT
jgi:hypothetical protein